MWRWYRSNDGVAAALTILMFLTGCSGEQEIEVGQPIEMGPWSFEVGRATDRIESRGNDQYKKISVTLRLHNYQERHEKPFDDFLNGTSAGSVIAIPKLELVDEAGTRFDGWVSPVSGGSLRSERWNAEFLLVPSSLSNLLSSNASDLAREHLDKRPGDLRLVIENADRRGDQPRRVSLQLR